LTVAGGDPKTGYPKTGTVVTGTLHEGSLPANLLPGRYRITFGNQESVLFTVSPNVYGMVRDASLMFFGTQRSGDGQSWFHAPSHLWDGWLFDTTGTVVGKDFYKGALSGGWYDCGDHLKETRTQSFALAMLGLTAATNPQWDRDHFAFNHSATTTDGIPDLVREVKWGSDFAIKAWALAGGESMNKAKLTLSVGNFGSDHGYWHLPEVQDTLPAIRRGNRREREIRKDWGSPSLADWAAGLAFASKLWKPYDQTGWSDSALTVAKAFYTLAKTTNAMESSFAYSGESKSSDDLALAATALLWATGTNAYLQDLAYTAGMPTGNGSTCGSTQAASFPASNFTGGFLGCGSDNMRKAAANTDWASIHAPALYAFHKLILKDTTVAKSFGISAAERAALEEKVIHNAIANLASLGNGTTSIVLPTSNKSFSPGGIAVKANPTWGTMSTQQDWVWNRYHTGNLVELALYLDITADLVQSGTILPNTPNPDWKQADLQEILLAGANTLLGMNPWDLSWILGVGTKNPMHPHHRAANPEGRNVLENEPYNYRIPAGALYGGMNPAATSTVFTDDWNDYFKSEVCLDGAALLTMFATRMSDDTSTAPSTTVGLQRTPGSSLAMELKAKSLGARLWLERNIPATARLELLDAQGKILSRQDWTTLRLELPRSRSVRIARLTTPGGVTHLTLPPY
jgi:hypothetical protein